VRTVIADEVSTQLERMPKDGGELISGMAVLYTIAEKM
jgi:hypothetical protein